MSIFLAFFIEKPKGDPLNSHLARCRFYCISLSETSDRHQNMLKLSARHGIDMTFIAAVNGSQLDEAQIKSIGYQYNESMARRPLTANELGCFLSHRKALKNFLESDAEFGLVLEDDAEFNDQLMIHLPKILDFSQHWDIFKLETRARKASGWPITRLEGFQVISLMWPSIGATAIIYSRSAAEKMFAMSQSIAMTYDAQFNWAWRLQIRILQIKPSLVWESQNGPSSIGRRPVHNPKVGLNSLIMRRWNRLLISIGRRAYAWYVAFRLRRIVRGASSL